MGSMTVETGSREATVVEEHTSLSTLALLFLRLGTVAFGGPAAHIAMMQDEVVRRRQWLSDERFLDLVSAANLIPGPNSTELAIHIGYERRKWAGLVVAGVCFIVPAMLITGAMGALYVTTGEVPAVGAVLYGVKPVILGVVVQAIAMLTKKALKTRALTALGIVSAAFVFAGVHELIVLFGAGLVAVAFARVSGRRQSADATTRAHAGVLAFVPLFAQQVIANASLSSIFLVFAKIGSVLFGSGYVLLAFLRADLVERYAWITEAQLIDAIAVGQVTPGPVFTTATFIGYLLQGPWGALVATAGIFLPAFVFVALSGPLVPRLRASPVASAFLDGVNVASLALMAVVTFELASAALVDVPTIVLGVAGAVALLVWKPNATWLIIAGALTGIAVKALGLA
jgi:chromate transporter